MLPALIDELLDSPPTQERTLIGYLARLGKLIDGEVGGDVAAARVFVRVVAPLMVAIGPEPSATLAERGGSRRAVVEHEQQSWIAMQPEQQMLQLA